MSYAPPCDDTSSAENPPQPSGPASEKGPEKKPHNGRDARGRFLAGNGGGPGNPFARQVAKLRAALVQRVTEEDIVQIAEQLITQAKLGNVAAIKLLFQYVLGKPADTVDPDTVDIEEWRQCYQPLGQIMQEVPKTMDTVPAKVACGIVAHIQPCHVHELAAVLSLPRQQLKELREEADDTIHYGELLREAARSSNSEERVGERPADPSPSANGEGGVATEPKAAPGGRRTERKRPPPSTNGGTGGALANGRRPPADPLPAGEEENGDRRGQERRRMGGAAADILAILLGRDR